METIKSGNKTLILSTYFRGDLEVILFEIATPSSVVGAQAVASNLKWDGTTNLCPDNEGSVTLESNGAITEVTTKEFGYGEDVWSGVIRVPTHDLEATLENLE